MQGADIHTVAQLLGHKDLRMAARYQLFLLRSWRMRLNVWMAFLAIPVTQALPRSKKVRKSKTQTIENIWRPQRDSNPRYRRERAVS